MVDEIGDGLETLLANPIANATIRLGVGAYRAVAAIVAVVRTLVPRLPAWAAGFVRAVATIAAAVLLDLADRIEAVLEAARSRARTWTRAAAGRSDPERVREVWQKVRQEVEPIEERLSRARAMVMIGRLESSLDESGEIWVEMTPATAASSPDRGTRLSCRVDFLSGDPGEPGVPLLSTRPAAFPERQPLSRFAGQDFRLNVAATMTITGMRFLGPRGGRRLRLTVGRLAGRSTGEKEVGAYLERRLAYFERLESEGLEGERVYAASREPGYMTIGRSRLGFTTRVGVSA